MDAYVPLDDLALRAPALIERVDWSGLAVPEARRLRELGFDQGVSVQVLHRARIGGGPIACQVGRMTVALRRSVAQHILVAREEFAFAAE